ncbi:hypothetical protein EYF80_013201 [Liparis tanakae]|uniref:Uncharacterized protein n=1 Tax=Liparis tanakae TaxID=230148 RepID=A0A4Z2IFI9_9TELE|nr:hypothetical protein EYF80_013201 [Liparis tanakae]
MASVRPTKTPAATMIIIAPLSVNGTYSTSRRSGMSKPKSAHSSLAAAIPDVPTTPDLLGMVMVWRTRKCTASMTRCRWSSPLAAPMAAMADAVMLLLERRSCWPW